MSLRKISLLQNVQKYCAYHLSKKGMFFVVNHLLYAQPDPLPKQILLLVVHQAPLGKSDAIAPRAIAPPANEPDVFTRFSSE
jgi:hypothetical protein